MRQARLRRLDNSNAPTATAATAAAAPSSAAPNTTASEEASLALAQRLQQKWAEDDRRQRQDALRKQQDQDAALAKSLHESAPPVRTSQYVLPALLLPAALRDPIH